MITREEAIDFIKKKLFLDNFEAKFGSQPVATLNAMVKSFHFNIPFQNLTILAKDTGTFSIPSLESIYKEVLLGNGGLCYTNNVFMKYLLEAIGVKTYHATSCCNPKHPDNHIVTVIENLKGSDYLVDVGSGYPTYEIILLNFQATSPFYQSAYLNYYFTRTGDQLLRYNRIKYPPGHDIDTILHKDEWKLAYSVVLEPRPLEYFSTSMREIYECRWLKKIRYISFSETDLKAIKENGECASLIEIGPNGKKEKSLASVSEVVVSLKDLCHFENDTLHRAVRNWDKCKES